MPHPTALTARKALAAYILALAALIAACGGGDATPTATSEPAPASTDAPTTAPTTEATSTDGGGDTAGPDAPALGEFVDAGGATVRLNAIAEPTNVDMIDPIPDGFRLVSIDVSMVGTENGKAYNRLFFGLLREDGQNIAIRVEPGGSSAGTANPGALQLVPRQPPFKFGWLLNGNLVRGWVNALVPADAGPLVFAVLNDAGDGFVPLAVVDGAAEPGPGTGAPIPVISAGLPLVSPEGTTTMMPMGGSGYEILEVLDPAPTNDDAPDGMRFVALNIRQTALKADERINLLDFAVQDTDGYLYYAFFDFGMARPNFQSSQGGASGEGFVTFAILEDAELVSLLAQPDFQAPHEHIARFRD